MDYKKVYNSIIEKAVNRISIDGYYERHHIIPKCKGGTNESNNIVKLTLREHFICHWLLHLIYPDDHKLLYAWNSFNMVDKNRDTSNAKINSKHYERCRSKFITMMKEKCNNDEDYYINFTMSSLNTIWINNNVKSKRIKECEKDIYLNDGWLLGRISFTRKPHSEEHKQKISKSHTGKVSKLKGRKTSETDIGKKAIKNMVETRSKKGEFRLESERQAEKLLKLERQKIVGCPHCNISGKNDNRFLKYHFDKCKHR